MNEDFERAQFLVKATLRELKGVLGRADEDISCYNPTALDVAINNLIEARTHMALGRDSELSAELRLVA